MPTYERITDLPLLTPADGSEFFEVSALSSTVTMTEITLSVDDTDDSFNDSALGFVAAGFAAGDRITVSGFTTGANNIFVGTILSVTTGKIITDVTTVVTETAGNTVTITKYVTNRVSIGDIAALATGGITIDPEETTSFDVTETMLRGNVYVPINAASAATVTVPPSLVGTEPVIFEQVGGGLVTFAPGVGVTIRNVFGLSMAGRYGTAILMPIGSDVYNVSGDVY